MRKSFVVALVGASVVALFAALGGSALATKHKPTKHGQYVLKHPGREHCKKDYVKKTRTIRKHGHKRKQVVCRYVAAKHRPYVLKHPGREHCKKNYVKKTRTIRKHGHKRKQVVCRYVAPKKAPSSPTPGAESTTTTLTATLEPGSSCAPVEGPKNKISICGYTVAYQTVTSTGQPVPSGEIVIKEHVPPSSEERKVLIPSGASVGIGWVASTSAFSTECTLNSTINRVEQPSYGCEKANPREILVAEYVPAPGSGYLASQSEPVTLE